MTQREKTPRLRHPTVTHPRLRRGDPETDRPARTPDPANRYSILGSIYRGGMGEILLAKVEGAGGFSRKVVLKGLLSRLSEDSVSYQLFMREACLMASLDHPNIVRVFDFPYINERPYLAMEYLRGRNFHQVIQRVSAVHGAGLPLRIALHVVAEALRGLHYAHSASDENGTPLGIIHRDVSPGNILLSFFGEVKVTDFGIAKVANAPQFTGPRSIRGKARYVAPEQVHGEPASVLSDIYSAGVVLSEALMGEPLWERASVAETLMLIVSEDREVTIDRILKRRPAVAGLRSALRGALALNRRDRFASALQFAETLEALGRAQGGPCSLVELGLYTRQLFRDAPDLPTHDGFGRSGLPVPTFEVREPQTGPTIIGSGPSGAMEPQPPGADDLPSRPETASMRRPTAISEMVPPDPTPPPITPEVEPDVTPPRAFPGPAHGSRIRAAPWPTRAAVLQDRNPVHIHVPVSSHRESEEYQFSEPLEIQATRPASSGRAPAQTSTILPSASRRRRKSDRTPAPPRPAPGKRAERDLSLLVAGIFIGGAIAIAGCLLALAAGN